MLRKTTMRRLLLCVLLVASGLGLVAGSPAGSAAAAPAAAPSTGQFPGYWLVASDGGVFTFGGVRYEGSAGAVPLRAAVVAMAPTPSGRGYWLVASDGGVFAYGDAPFAGSLGGLPASARPTSPVVAIVPTPSGQGYWMATANGSIYSFGDAPFFGSAGGTRLGGAIVAMAATPDGTGYWLVGADGGVLTYGSAKFYGSAGAIHLSKPIVGMAADPAGTGYWLVASDGGVFSFGTAQFQGSTGAIRLNQPIVGMAADPTGVGYWLVASDGGIFSFGASFRGSAGGRHLNRPIVGMAAGISVDPFPPAGHGFDISWPQCGSTYPTPFDFAVVGVNDGHAFSQNPCLASELNWGSQAYLSLYMNLNSPPPNDPASLSGPAGTCMAGDTGCMAYNYGYNAAVYSYKYATAQGANAGVWWVDVETANSWDSNQFNNSRTIQGALDALGASGAVAGIYSTYVQFPAIAGGYAPQTPIWVPESTPGLSFDTWCTSTQYRFAGGRPWLVQYQTADVPQDQDFACAS
jgi:hypothetical protein